MNDYKIMGFLRKIVAFFIAIALCVMPVACNVAHHHVPEYITGGILRVPGGGYEVTPLTCTFILFSILLLILCAWIIGIFDDESDDKDANDPPTKE